VVKSDLQLAHELLFGFTRPQEIQKAIRLYQDEASKEVVDPSAFNALGQIYEEGRFVAKDIKKAFFFYKKSAEKKDPEGLYRIGKMLEKGSLNFKQEFEGLYANRSA
jgi:TPR repeat protein